MYATPIARLHFLTPKTRQSVAKGKINGSDKTDLCSLALSYKAMAGNDGQALPRL